MYPPHVLYDVNSSPNPPPPLPHETKWVSFPRRHIQTLFRDWKYLNYKQNFIEICSFGSDWQYEGIGSDNSLVPSRRQAIAWTNVDPVQRRIYAALGGRWVNSLLVEFSDAVGHTTMLFMYWQRNSRPSFWFRNPTKFECLHTRL